MKKVLIVTGPMTMGGTLKSLLSFLKHIRNFANIDIVFWSKGIVNMPLPEKVNVLNIPTVNSVKSAIKQYGIFSRSFFISLFGSFLKNRWKIMPKLKKEYDIAISYTTNGYPMYYVANRVIAKEKFLWFHHGSYDITGDKKEKEFECFSRFDKLITVTEANKKMLCNVFPSLSNKFEVIGNIVDIEEIQRLALEPINDFNNNSKTIVTVGRLSEEKGQLFALEVANKINKQGFDFNWYFIGEGDLYDKCIDKVNEFGLEKKCFFIGNKINPYPYMADADIYVQPSFIESECITIKEALALNKTVLTTDLPAIREVLNDGEFGYIEKILPSNFSRRIIDLFNKENSFESDFGVKHITNNNEVSKKSIEKLII